MRSSGSHTYPGDRDGRDGGGCSDAAFAGSPRAYVTPTSTTNHPMSSDIPSPPDAGPDLTASPGDPVRLNGSNSSDDVGITSYEWDVDGDGTTDLTGEVVTDAFGSPGTYTVALTVTDAAGNADTDTANVTVVNATPPTPGTLRVTDVSPANATVTRGDGLNVTVALANPGTRPASRNLTLEVNGTVLATEPVRLVGGATGNVTLTVSTAPLRPGVRTLVVGATGDATVALTVESEERGLHESGVPMPVFLAVAGPDGVLDRADVLAMVEAYVDERPTNGVRLERGELTALVEYYAEQS